MLFPLLHIYAMPPHSFSNYLLFSRYNSTMVLFVAMSFCITCILFGYFVCLWYSYSYWWIVKT